MDPQISRLLGKIPELRNKKILVEAMPGGMTNRNYKIQAGDEHYVLRIAGENTNLLGIDRSIEHACAQAAFIAAAGPEVVAFLPDDNALITRFVPGMVLSDQEVRNPATLELIVTSLRGFHTGQGTGYFSAFETIRRYAEQARAFGVDLPDDIPQALKKLTNIETLIGPPKYRVPCHNDLLAANFVKDAAKVWILDWEYSGVGDIFFDLANLASNNSFGATEEKLLLHLYFGETTPDDLFRLQLMRRVSDLRECLWGFLQLGISRIQFDYSAYAMFHLDRFNSAAPPSD